VGGPDCVCVSFGRRNAEEIMKNAEKRRIPGRIICLWSLQNIVQTVVSGKCFEGMFWNENEMR
jgi:hypothetical protein